MTSLKTILMGSVAAISLAAAPAISQETTTEGDAAETQQQQTAEATSQRSYDEVYGEEYGGLGERSISELVGTELVTDAGETIGEIDNFGLAGDKLVAIVGIGGFLGIGEHSVALPLDRLTYDGEKLVISNVTREELEALPAYNEGDAQTVASDETFRSGYEAEPGAGGATDTAAMQPSEDPATDQPMADAEEQVAEAESSAEQATEEQAAQAEQAAEEAGQDVAQATEEAGEEVEQAAEQTGQAVESAGEEATSEVAEAGQEMADEAEQMAESAEAEVTEETAQADTSGEAAQTETETAQAEPTEGEAQPETETAQTETAGDSEQMTTETAGAEGGEQATEETQIASEGGWTEEMDSIFSDIADRQIAELIGMEVASAEGEVVGEVDNFALDGDQVVAIVGIGGFLGIGEHEVALSLGDMTYDGERLVLSSMTEEQLREMPEFEEAEANYLPEDGTLRSTYNQ